MAARSDIKNLLPGFLSFLVLIPGVVYQGEFIHLFSVFLGGVLSFLLRSRFMAIITGISLFSFFIPEVSSLSKWYPVIMNALGFLLFSFSLFTRQSIIYRFALLEKGDALSPDALPYCWSVTLCWVIFFLMNGSIAAWTVMNASDTIWAWYNGGVSYVLVSVLFFGERILRHRFIGSEGA